MNTVLWILQGLAALVYGASGVMKVFSVSGIPPVAKDTRSWA